MADDYYETLGVGRSATQAEIQKAYRNLARKHHPDLNPNDKTAKEKFQKVQAAFDVLNDKEKRAKYDRFGPAFEQMGSGGHRQTWSTGSFEGIDLGDILSGMEGAEAGGF